MNDCVNITRKIHISSNFIFSMSSNNIGHLRPSLHCNTPLDFTKLHPTALHYTYGHFTSSHLHFTTLSFSFTHSHFLSFYFTSHHITRHSTDLISNLISKIMNHSTALKYFLPFHFTSLFISLYFIHLSCQPYTSLYFGIHNYNSLPFTSLPFTFYLLLPLLPLTALHFPNPRWKICVLPREVPVATSCSLFRSVMVLSTISVPCFLALIF